LPVVEDGLGHCHIEQVEAVIDHGEARLRHWNRLAGLSPAKPAIIFGRNLIRRLSFESHRS
jgi:hypothetical protein